jgi:hypothetical protein
MKKAGRTTMPYFQFPELDDHDARGIGRFLYAFLILEHALESTIVWCVRLSGDDKA